MKIALLGTGSVGRALAGRLDGLGHDVVVGTRDPEATLARTEPDAMGAPPYAGWAADHPGVRLATFPDAAAAAELVVNAKNGDGSLEALTAAGAEHLAGKTLLDIATVLELLESFGHDDVIDLGALETARGTEMLLPIWVRLMGALGTAEFNFKVVRAL